MREFTSPLILFMMTGEDDNYFVRWLGGIISLASGGARGPTRETLSRVYPRWSHYNGMECWMA